MFLHFLPLMSPGPCPPTNVSVSTLCGVSTVSWSPDTRADVYIATATTHDGHNYTCDSGNASSCSFTDLGGGENYSVTVVAVDRGCHSTPSSAVDLKTGEKMFNKGTAILIFMCYVIFSVEVRDTSLYLESQLDFFVLSSSHYFLYA